MGGVRAYVPLESEVEAVCGALGPNAAVIESDPDANSGYTQTMRSFCNVPSAGLVKPSPQVLATARAAAAAHGRALYVLTQDPTTVPFVGAPRRFFDAATEKWPERLVDVPQVTNRFHITVWLGRVEPSGRVTPVTRES
jgi:hypothetical protein